MGQLRAVDVEFLQSAPVVVTRTFPVAAPRDEVFAAVADDPAGWSAWFPGFSAGGGWVDPAQTGEGARRRIRMPGATFEETVLARDPAAGRFAFRVDRAPGVGVRALAEDWVLTADGAAGCTLAWTMAVDAAGPAGVVRGAVGSIMSVLGPRATRRLAAVLTTCAPTGAS